MGVEVPMKGKQGGTWSDRRWIDHSLLERTERGGE